MGDLWVLGVDGDGDHNNFVSLRFLDSSGGGLGCWRNLGRDGALGGDKVLKEAVQERTGVVISAPGTVANGPLDFLGEVKARSVHGGVGILGSDEVQTGNGDEGREDGDGVGTHVEQYCT